MKDLAEAIKERRNEILRLQTELDLLERARALLNGGGVAEVPAFVAALEANHRLRAARPVRVPIPLRSTSPHPMRGRINPKSSIGHSIALLNEKGVPLHVNDLIAGIRKRGGEAKKTSLVSTLMKMSKRRHVFFKDDKPSTFGLLQWKSAQQPLPVQHS